MRQIRPEYEFPVEGRAWTRGEVPTAGVYFLRGDCHIVSQHGPAAMDLEERGALLIALVRFDRDAMEGRSSESSIRPLDLMEAVSRFAPPSPGGEPGLESRVRSRSPLDGRWYDGDS